MPFNAVLQLVRISIFVDLPQQACSVICIDDLCVCHLQHVDAWIVVVIVLVTIIIIIIIITVTIMIIDCAVSSDT
jgi:hypothetical protein